MKTLDEYMAMDYRMEIVKNKDEGGYMVCFPDLPGCLTCGETVETAVANAMDAKRAWLETAIEAGMEISEPDSLDIRKRFDYTKWQRQKFDQVTAEEFTKEAIEYAKNAPFYKK
ncbi:MAG: type II toxin-antitoxin system HicB family antitoxin [Lachnospiraceae bacterium]|nr:type II toxin-antitoxin system HicB family antitoxin [Lachnospiraceae bacterium]